MDCANERLASSIRWFMMNVSPLYVVNQQEAGSLPFQKEGLKLLHNI
jgi:hypothetical protein